MTVLRETLTWSGENGAREWNSIFKTLGCYFYRSHKKPHTKRSKGYKLLPVSALASYRLISTMLLLAYISLACHSATSTSQWVIVPITPHFLCSEGFCCVVAAREQYPTAWHSSHYGLMEVKVFLRLSQAHSASQVPHRSPSEGLIKNALTWIHTDTRIPVIIHVSHLAETLRFCSLPPSALFCASIQNHSVSWP